MLPTSNSLEQSHTCNCASAAACMNSCREASLRTAVARYATGATPGLLGASCPKETAELKASPPSNAELDINSEPYVQGASPRAYRAHPGWPPPRWPLTRQVAVTASAAAQPGRGWSLHGSPHASTSAGLVRVVTCKLHDSSCMMDRHSTGMPGS